MKHLCAAPGVQHIVVMGNYMSDQINKHLSGFERHLRILQALSDKSIQSYRAKVEEFFNWKKNNIPPVSSQEITHPVPSGHPSQEGIAFTRQDIEAYLEYCYYKGNGNQTRFTKLIALQKYFRYLVYERIIKEDVTAMIPRPKVSRKFVQKFSKDDVLGFFRVVNITTEKGLRDIVILILAAFCGLRVNEIIELSMNDIIDDGKSLDINVIDSKHNSNRVVYLWKAPSLFVRQWLSIRLTQGAKAGDPFLVSYWKSGKFRGDGTRRLTSVAIGKIVKRYAKMANIRKARVHIHMFRATHASDLRYIRGYDIAAIAQRLGHKHISSTDRYLPSRERIHREYRSLAEYWQEFTNLWTRKEDKGGEENRQESSKVNTPQEVPA